MNSVDKADVYSKKTKAEQAEQIYKKEKKRYNREQERINRANGLPTPPERSMSRSISPLPRRSTHSTHSSHTYTNPNASSSSANTTSSEDDEIQYIGQTRNVRRSPGPSDHLRRREAEIKKREDELLKRERELRRKEEEQLEYEDITANNPFGNVSFEHAGPSFGHVPHRYQHHQHHHPQSHARFAPPLFSFNQRMGGMGGIPEMGDFDPDEFKRWVRDRFERSRAEARRAEESFIRQQKQTAERDQYFAEEKRKEDQRRAQEKKDKKAREADRLEALREQQRAKDNVKVKLEDTRKLARERYTARWKALTDVGGDIEESEIRYIDVPWPIYDCTKEMEKSKVKEFMIDLAKENGENVKKTLRETIRAFHPDRFFGRVLPRTREQDREKVKEGVEACSRIINALLGEL